jgi:hypothetical protein
LGTVGDGWRRLETVKDGWGTGTVGDGDGQRRGRSETGTVRDGDGQRRGRSETGTVRDGDGQRRGRGQNRNVYCSFLIKINFKTVMLTFLCRDRDRPVTVLSPFFRTPSLLRPPCVPRVKRSFSVPKRSLIYDA